MVKTNSTSPAKLASIAKSNRSSEGSHAAGAEDSLRSEFYVAALNMGWQLAVVVLLPIVGGYKLDAHYSTLPLWTLVGLVVSLAGSIVVIRRALSAFGNFTPAGTDATNTETSTKDSRS